MTNPTYLPDDPQAEREARQMRLATEDQAIMAEAHALKATLKAIYDQSHDIDEVIAVMHTDLDRWYEFPFRDGNVIYAKKSPYDPEGYAQVETEEEKRRAYCHCPMIRSRLEAGISPNYCLCGTGWYRQYWEGILGEPLRIEMLKNMLKGDEICQFAIHLPIET